MKIGLIKETKIPIDNRVALTPQQMAQLQKSYPDDQFVVQSSPIRAYTDEAYRQAGIQVCNNIDDCDVLFGIKEADIQSLIPHKHNARAIKVGVYSHLGFSTPSHCHSSG